MAEVGFSRRRFLKLMGLSAVAFSAAGKVVARKAKRRPNVVLIFTDDQGTVDVNCYGSKDLYTPHMDSLAKRGTRFTQFYVGAPVCSPSRAALLTGRYPQRAQLSGNTSSQKGKAGMPTEQRTIAEMMKDGGYVTGHVGKWHLGYTPETMPNGQGFDYSFGHMGGCIDNYSHFFYWNGPNRHDLWRNGEEIWRDGEHFGDLMADECEEFIEGHKDEPFFLYWAINMPHYPLQGQEKFRKMYADMDEPRRSYAAFVSTADEKIGQVVGKIDELGLREDTIIIYLSDHGHSEEIRNNFGGSGGSAGPHRGHKFTLWEGGIRVPCIVSWPGRIPVEAVRGQVAVSIDWMPTIAEYCGVAVGSQKIDGRSIVRVIASEGAESPHDVVHWQQRNRWAVRKGDWKLVMNEKESVFNGKKIDSQRTFLANLGEDLSETRNYASKRPDVVKELAALHEAWAGEVERQ